MDIDKMIRNKINNVSNPIDKNYLLKTYKEFGGKDIEELIFFTLSEYSLCPETLKELTP